MDGKFQSFTFGKENNTIGITYIVVDSATNEVQVKNLPSQRISIPISSSDYCVSISIMAIVSKFYIVSYNDTCN